MIIAEYSVQYRYGGPEEGGWWYDWYTFQRVAQRGGSKARLRDQAQTMTEKAAAEKKARRDYPRWSAAGSPDTVYVVERSPGRKQRQQRRPHYE